MILVADDSEDIRNLFGVMLKKNYDVRFAVNSDETLAGADTDPLPDLILLDVEMPSMNGYEVCAQLKANPALAHIPVIFVTARSDPKDQARGTAGRRGRLHHQADQRADHACCACATSSRWSTSAARSRTRSPRAPRSCTRRACELIRRLARAMEFREGGLTNRVLRVSEYVELLSQALGLKSKVVEILSQAAPLYDIGKLGVPEHILHEERQAERQGMGRDAQAPGNRRRHHRRAQGPAAGAGARHGAHPPRALGRHRLPEEAEGQRDPGRRAASWRWPTPSRP